MLTISMHEERVRREKQFQRDNGK